MSSLDRAIDAALDAANESSSSTEFPLLSHRLAELLLEKFRKSGQMEDIKNARNAAEKAVQNISKTDPRCASYAETLKIIELHAAYRKAVSERYYYRLPSADDTRDEKEKREYLEMAKRVALAYDYKGVFSEVAKVWEPPDHGKNCRCRECKGKGSVLRGGPYVEASNWIANFDASYNWDIAMIVQHIENISAYPEAYIVPIHQSSIEFLRVIALKLKDRIYFKFVHEGSTSHGKLHPDIALYFDQPISLFTVFDQLGFIMSVTASPYREPDELSFHLPLLALYAKWCTVLASTCVRGTAYSDQPPETLDNNELVPFMLHLAVITHPTFDNEDGVLLGSTLGLAWDRGPIDPNFLDSRAWSLIGTEREILQLAGFKRPDGDRGKNFGQCAETVFLELGMKLRKNHPSYDILQSAWGFALQLKHAPDRRNRGRISGQATLPDTQPIEIIAKTTQYDQSYFLPLLRDPCVSCQSLFDQLSRGKRSDIWKVGFEARLVEEGIQTGRLRPTDRRTKDNQSSQSTASEKDPPRPDQEQETPSRTIPGRIEHDSFFGPPPVWGYKAPDTPKIRSPFAARRYGFTAKNYPKSVKGLPYRTPSETKMCKDRYSKHTVSCSGWILDLSTRQWLECGSRSTQHKRITHNSQYSAEPPFMIEQESFGGDTHLGGLCIVKETGERVMCPGWTKPGENRLLCHEKYSLHDWEKDFDIYVFEFEESEAEDGEEKKKGMPSPIET